MESYNENLVGGDINGGVQDLGQIVARPVAGAHPYATSDDRIFLCSSSTPPGGGVHGMCGYHAARLAIERWGK
jgi:phytoene dehydrogenase-like protein